MSKDEIIAEHMFFYQFRDDQMSNSAILCNALLNRLLEDNKSVSAMFNKYFKICEPSEFWGVKKMFLRKFFDLKDSPVLELVKFGDTYKFALFTFNQFLSPLGKKKLKDPEIIKVLMDFFTEPEKYIKQAIDEIKAQ